MSRGEIRDVMSELFNWLLGKPHAIQLPALDIVNGLNAAQIGSRPHTETLRKLAADIEKLRRARAETLASMTRTSSR